MAKKIISLLLVLSLLCNFAACDNAEPGTTSSATIEKSPTPTPTLIPSSDQETPIGTGTTSRTEDSEKETVTLEAFPAEDCGFIGWASDEAGETIVSYYNPYTFNSEDEVPFYPVFIHNEQVIEFQDAAVEAEIQQQLGTTAITYGNLQQITTLLVSFHGEHSLSTLKDLAYFHSLKYLQIRLKAAYTYDCSPLANLINIETLIIMDADVEGAFVEFLPIENYKNLVYLEATYTGKDITPFAVHANTLEQLRLYYTTLEDYSFLSKLTRLTHLQIYDGSLDDSHLQYLPNTLTWLDLRGCTNIQDISPIRNCTNLTYLQISDASIYDITPLHNLKSIKYLILDGNYISDLSPLSELSNLAILEVRDNKICDMDPIMELEELDDILWNGNPIKVYDFLEKTKENPHSYAYRWQVSQAQEMVDSLIRPEMTQMEKYWVLAKALCEKASVSSHEFDANIPMPSYGNQSTTIFELPAEEEYSCFSYAETYQLLCSLAGLLCYQTSGSCIHEEVHSWNIVELDGQYYHVDVAWMDRDDTNIDKSYFLKSDSFFKSHTHADWRPVELCNDTSKDFSF